MNTVYIGADHRGYQTKGALKEALRASGYNLVDLGNEKYNSEDDYTNIGIKVAEKVALENGKGILICGSGVGVCIIANKANGIRAALCLSEKQARLSREDDDANILCLSADLIDCETNLNIAKTFLETFFSSEERHIRRIKKIEKYETTKIS
jgi:ribose 5-phosphate isomerase B